MSIRQTIDDEQFAPIRIGPDDRRYQPVVVKRFNKRFSASPDYVQLISSTGQMVTAVEDAVKEGRRLVVTSGGHCLEGFVSDPSVRVIVDVSPMKRVYYDSERGAVAVEAGATVGETFRALFERWGVLWRMDQYRLTWRDRLRASRFDPRHRMHDRLAGAAGGTEESDMGPGVLSGSVCRKWRRSGSECSVRRGIDQSSRHRPRGCGAEYVWRALARAGLQGRLPALQRIKARWDPRDVFHHALSIRGV
jgi:hypothetical protein